MKPKYFILILIIIPFLVSACFTKVLPERPVCNKPYILVGNDCCLDKNNNSVCDKDEKFAEEKPAEKGLGEVTGKVVDESAKDLEKEKVETMPKPKTEEKIENYYDLEQLEEDIKKVMDASYYNFERDPSHPDYVRSNQLKYYVIHTIDNEKEKINNADEFCSKYCAKDWDGWKYFLNMSNFRILHPILTRENFSTESQYKDYVQHASYVRFTIKETPYKVDNGEVLEYQLYLDLTDLFGTFAGVYDESLVIYKIYCSPNMTILLRPRWDTFNKVSWPAATLEEVDKTWDNYLLPVREEFLSKANKLLGKCNVKKEFFEGQSFPKYSKSEQLSAYWRTYYKYYLNLTSSVKVGVVPSTEDGKLVLKQINISFVNDDYFDLYDLGLRIIVTADDKSTTDYYDKEFEGIYRPGKTILNKSLSLKDIKFLNNLAIDVNLYTIEGKGEIRPLRVFLSKEDFK